MNSKRTLGPEAQQLDSQLCFALYSTMLGMNKVYRKALRGLGLTYPQYLVMLVLWEQDGQRVSDICAKLYLETTTLTPLLKRMETQGLLQRQRSAADERQVIVSLTPEGKAMQEAALSVPACIAEAAACPLAEIAALRDQLHSLRARLFAVD